MSPSERRPGDDIIDRYMPNATPEERDKAHVNLRSYADVLLRIFMRRADEKRDADSLNSQGQGKIWSVTPDL